jgi:hypothetical protein
MLCLPKSNHCAGPWEGTTSSSGTVLQPETAKGPRTQAERIARVLGAGDLATQLT